MSLAVPTIREPEILAPAGSPACLPAAVAGGATAVYLGLRHFNARGRAENFRKAELPGHVAYLHRHGLKCYVVLNTLVHEDELPKALDLAAHALASGVDAAIVQDLGLATLLRQQLPALPVHASTQMTVHDPSQVRALAACGVSRVIVARELALPELRNLSATAHDLGLDLEHFVHGALCYALSGQCLMSNFAGCRSANRGTCAQNCRFVYRQEDGELDTTLSMRDLSLVERVGELMAAGVASFKIEGRLKGPDYVYTVSRAYADAVAALREGRRPPDAGESLRTVFARPFTSTPLDGEYGPSARLRLDGEGELVDARLRSLRRDTGQAVLEAAVAPRVGQGYTYTMNGFRGGFQIRSVSAEGNAWRCRISIERRGPPLPAGTPLRCNSDGQRLAETRRALAKVPLAKDEQSLSPALDCQLALRLGQPACLRLSQGGQLLVEQHAEEAVQPASGRALDGAAVAAALGSFGGSGYALGNLQLELDEGVFTPLSQLKALRRAALAALPPPAQLQAELQALALPQLSYIAPPTAPPRPRHTALAVAVSSLEAADAALAAGASQVWLDDPSRDLWSASADIPPPPGAPGQAWLRHPAAAALSPQLGQWAAAGWGVVAGHLGVLQTAQGLGMAALADAACNVYSTASLSALAQWGAQAAVLSLELSAREVARLVSRAQSPALPALALVVHGRVPAMLTRQDHGLAPGEQTTIQAIPREGGLPYEIQRASGGWTAIWEGRRLAAPEAALATAGLVDWWVLELADLAPAAVIELISAYAQLRDGGIAPEVLMTIARRHAAHGCFPGHLHQGSRALDLMQPASEEEESHAST